MPILRNLFRPGPISRGGPSIPGFRIDGSGSLGTPRSAMPSARAAAVRHNPASISPASPWQGGIPIPRSKLGLLPKFRANGATPHGLKGGK